jgi:hypothetical protein
MAKRTTTNRRTPDPGGVRPPLSVVDPDRCDAILWAARKIEILAEALVTHSDCAEKFEDISAVASIVSSVARRQRELAGVIIRALDGSTDSSIDLGSEAHNG